MFGLAGLFYKDTENKCLRYSKIVTLEALFLLGYREANSEGFSVWGKYGQIGEKVVIRQNVANDLKGFTAH